MQCLALHLGVKKVGGSAFQWLDFLTELPATCSTAHCCCQAHLCARAIAPFLYNHHLPSMPHTSSREAKHFPGALHREYAWGRKWSGVSQWTWPDQVNSTLWYLFMTGGPTPSSQSHINKQPDAQKFLASYQAWSSLGMISHTPGSSANSFKGMGRARCSLKSKHKRDRRKSHLSPHSASSDLDGLEISAHAWVTSGN